MCRYLGDVTGLMAEGRMNPSGRKPGESKTIGNDQTGDCEVLEQEEAGRRGRPDPGTTSEVGSAGLGEHADLGREGGGTGIPG